MADPKCPSCGVEGMDNIVSKESEERAKRGNPWFYVVHCVNCGHVYGVFPKHIFGGGSGPQLVVAERKR